MSHFCARKGNQQAVGEKLFAISDRAPRVPRTQHDNPLLSTKRGYTKPYSKNRKLRLAQMRAVRIRARVQAGFTKAWKRGEI